MADQVVGGKADEEEVSGGVVAELFAGDESAGEVEFVGVGGRGGADFFVEIFGSRNIGFLCGLSSAVPIIEGGDPVGECFHVVAGGDKGTGGRLDPVGSIGGVAGG